ncbi:MAG: hypothetical protein M1824_001989 [Vezdaea acicularis]|nr:MAG: hypothetical protein M1824_001989 [Vezdaea acicularis]
MTVTPTEPHPTPVPTRYAGWGRGGAGNIRPISPSLDTTPAHPRPQPPLTLPKTTSTRYTTGRGGAGNVCSRSSERAIFSFDEELAREQRREERHAPVYYVGRGGAGNFVGPQARDQLWPWEEERMTSTSMRRGSWGSDESRTTQGTNASDRSDRSVTGRMNSVWARFSEKMIRREP